jgi:hypothetical protein
MGKMWIIGQEKWCEIHCGCCGDFFETIVGGSAFCGVCLNGAHPNCHRKEIMGIKDLQ